jgi:hypothetical protein
LKVTLGTTVIAAGTAGGEPSRLAGGTGTKAVQLSEKIRSAKASLFGRGNRSYVDIVEADYEYATPQLAKAGIVARRVAALAASGSLVYGDGDDATAIGTGEIRTVELVEWTGCGFTLRFEIVAVEA